MAVTRLASQPAADTPPPHIVQALTAALLAGDRPCAERLIMRLTGYGPPAEQAERALYLLAAVARHMGGLWDEDRITAADAILAAHLMNEIARDGQPTAAWGRPPAAGRVALCTVPGETHSLGLRLVSARLGRAGWPCSLYVGLDEGALVAELVARGYRLIGLSIACQRCLPALAELTRAIRRAIPAAFLFVGGVLVDRMRAAVSALDCDAVVDGQTDLEALLQDTRAGRESPALGAP
ncbi:MAG: cobalamin-dependent protein [Pseudomonadota bacterium]